MLSFGFQETGKRVGDEKNAGWGGGGREEERGGEEEKVDKQ